MRSGQPDLPHAFLARHIQHRFATSEGGGQLKQQRRLANAGLATEERHRTGHKATSEDPVELLEPALQAPDWGGDNLPHRCRRRAWAAAHVDLNDGARASALGTEPQFDDDRFKKNYKIQGYLITTNDLTIEISGRLTNTNDPQRVPIASLGTTELLIEVKSTYPAEPAGDRPPFNELALQAVRFFGSQG